MTFRKEIRAAGIIALVLTLSACGVSGRLGNSFGGSSGGGSSTVRNAPRQVETDAQGRTVYKGKVRQSTIWDLFGNNDDPNITVEVNKYIWRASLEVLNFMPIQTVDPFTGVIVYGYGRPPGGGQPYRATVYVQDPALDARSLKVALQSRSGPVSADTVRAVEDAILTRARQLRIQDGKL
ncbi:MAG: DUF3576 domain-containing protein [Vannielia sp.]|uniref:DUF3576 domain-containing protein n=1 Tax=Rhodobacterales TaxID=204455 RepID=UPI002096136B|nr:DUF3576 domain-containing protein [Oceanicola sp. 502str15]MCO6384524.1 DUF3576 domain-containing protein [Oceanicola sp. 502str15]